MAVAFYWLQQIARLINGDWAYIISALNKFKWEMWWDLTDNRCDLGAEGKVSRES